MDFVAKVYPKLSTSYYSLLETLTGDHMQFVSTLEPNVLVYILSTISEGISAVGK
jgi:exportin-7